MLRCDRLSALAALVSTVALAAGAPSAPAAYAGLGTWIDVYDAHAWAAPEATAAAIRARGVRTLYLQTSNSNRSSDLVRAAGLGRLVDAAHARGLRVVAWYLPTLLHPARDLRRALAAIRFRTQTGGSFDSFALDIESSSVRAPALRNARLLDLSRRLRLTVGPSYALGAIIPSPRGMQLLPHYWPGFPYSDLYRIYDVFLPMAYFSYRAHGTAPVARYVERSVEDHPGAHRRSRRGDPRRRRNLAANGSRGGPRLHAGRSRLRHARLQPVRLRRYEHRGVAAADGGRAA